MKMLIHLVENEFARAGYTQLTEGLWVNSEQTDFWLVCVLQGDYQLKEFQEQLLSDYASLFSEYKLMEKNTSLLLLNEVEYAVDKKPGKVVADENDPYDFKKYIIQYTQDEWKQAKVFLEEKESLANVLMQPDIFAKLKKDGVNSPVALLYTIAHKLPFVMMPVEHKEFQFRNELFYNDQQESELDDWLNTIVSKGDISHKIDELLNSISHD